jgi:hypothetical protein
MLLDLQRLPHADLPDIILDSALGPKGLHYNVPEPGHQQSGSRLERGQLPVQDTH